jgi:lysophospholipase L1-like esterase
MPLTHVRFRLLAGLAALLASAGLVAGSALPASADTGNDRRVLTYVALGDSYAAGQAGDCTHTASSYPLRLDALHRVKLLRDASCASATTETVRTTQLAALNRGVKLVTLTVGANDLHVDRLVPVCASAPSSDSCRATIAALASPTQLEQLGANLIATYSAIAARAPHAEILVTGYPALASSGYLAAAEDALNLTIQLAVRAVAQSGVDIRYVPVDFTGHTADSPNPADSWFNLTGPNIFHPNAAGDEAIEDALAAALR